MNFWVQQFLTKLLVTTSVFAFAVVCCSPLNGQTVSASHAQSETNLLSHSGDSYFQDAHPCDHNESEQVQGVVQKTVLSELTNVAALASTVNAAYLYQTPSLDSEFLWHPRLTGPPWDEKNIKAFLGVFRS